MKTKADKQAILTSLKGEFLGADAVVICKFEGLTVAEDQQLRGALRSLGARYRVVSNRLAHIAAKDTPYEAMLQDQRGMTALAFPGEDLIGAVKALVGYAKEQEHFSFSSGVVEGRALDIGGLTELSRLPGKEGVYAQLLFLINSPAQRLLSTVNAPGRNIAAVVQQGVEHEKFAG